MLIIAATVYDTWFNPDFRNPASQPTQTQTAGTGAVTSTNDGSHQTGDIDSTTQSPQSNTLFGLTAALIVATFASYAVGGTTSSQHLLGVAVIVMIVSVVMMYWDLQENDLRLWSSPPSHWAVIGALFFIFVAPLYLYFRWKVTG